MSSFVIGETISASFRVVRKHWKMAFSLSKKPVLVLVAVMVASILLQVLVAGNLTEDMRPALQGEMTGEIISIPVFIGFLVCNLIGLIAILAFILNWQSFLILDRYDMAATRAPKALPDFMGPTVWRARFKKYVLRYLFLFLCFLVVYISFFGIALFLREAQSSFLFVVPLLFFILLIVAIPYVSRLAIAFPMIAGDAEDNSFSAALALTRGMGWRIFLAQFCTMLLAYLGMFALMMVVMIVFAILGAISGFLMIVVAIPAMIGLIIFLVAMYLLMVTPHVLIYMQLSPEHVERWAELSAKPTKTDPPTKSDDGKPKDHL